MTTPDHRSELNEALEFAYTHRIECAKEILEWSSCGILNDGRLRELAMICQRFCGEHHSLPVAEDMVKNVALKILAGWAAREKAGEVEGG